MSGSLPPGVDKAQRAELVELLHDADTVLADVSVEQAEVLADAILAAGWRPPAPTARDIDPRPGDVLGWGPGAS